MLKCARRFAVVLSAIAWAILGPPGLAPKARAADVAELIQEIRSVGPRGAQHSQVVRAQRSLIESARAEHLPAILGGIDGSNPLAANWLRGAFEAVSDRCLKSEGKLPQGELEKFVSDRKHSPHGRRLAFEWLEKVDKSARARLEPGWLDDPSLELRRDAVATALAQSEGLIKQGDKPAAAKSYRNALSHARDLDQIQDAAKRLRELGEKVDLAEHFGFVRTWQLIGPFDNRNKVGFDTVYPPEKQVQLGTAVPGKEGEVRWTLHTTGDEMGVVDLNKAIAKHMGAAAYGYAEFDSPTQRPIELRLGCINANKVWLNGELLVANHVYHANTSLDQYIGRGQLKAGKNQILVKICQNEQTDSWAQDWKFQLRLCDDVGTAVLPVTATGNK